MNQVNFDSQGIAEQRKVCEAATGKAWTWYGDALLTTEGEKTVIAKHVDADFRISVACRNSDKVFIAASRTAYPAALNEIERLQQFEAESAALRVQVASLTRERDAAVKDLRKDCTTCAFPFIPYVKHSQCVGCTVMPMFCKPTHDGWQWRGPCAENAPEGNTDG